MMNLGRKLVLTVAALPILSALSTGALAQGGLYVTGHDSDWHAMFNGPGPQHIVQTAVNYVTNHKSNPSILFVTDSRYIGLDSTDTQGGLTISGFTNYTLADDGTSYLDVSTANFANYDAVVVASSGGGLLHQSELDKLNARAGDLVNYINGGGGLVAFAESLEYPGGTKTDLYGFLPFLVSSNSLPQGESTFRVTPFGASLGLTDADVSAAFAHNTFTSDAGMNVVDRDNFGQGSIISLAYYGRIGIQGPTVPEPGTLSLAGAMVLGLGGLMVRRKRSS